MSLAKQKLSEKQKKFIAESNARVNIAHGAVSSGKTYSSLIRFGLEVPHCPDSDIIMIGRSASTIYENAVKPFAINDNALFKGYCSWSPGNRVLTFAGKEIRTIGAHDESSVGAIQGNNISIAYVDEMSLLPQNFLNMLLSRLRKPHSILFGTTNPDSPHHPVKQLIDLSDGKEYYSLHFEMKDNPNLTESYTHFIEKTYSGLWYKRFVQGLWVQAEGAIYQCWDRKNHVISRISAPEYYICGVDVGSSNPFAAVLIGINRNMTPRIIVHKEYFWDPKVTGRSKTHAEFADDLDRFLSGYPIRCVYIDPSAEAFEIEVRKRKRTVKHASNDVFNGVSSVGSCLSNGNLMIHDSCTNLIREIEGYVWDPKRAIKGEDVPLKVNDHLVDALRYAVYSAFGNRPFIEAPSESNSINHMNYPGFGGPGWQVFGGGAQFPFGKR